MTDQTTEATPVDSAEDELANGVSTFGEQPPEDDTEGSDSDDTEGSDSESDPEMFPREYVENLRQENGRYRQRAQRAGQLAQRLHTELVRSTGRLADPDDLAFDEAHLDDPDALAAAVDDLLARKPHLASRKPVGDIGQGIRGSAAASVGLLDLLKAHT
ncbi:hypothetical protein [Mycolicibacterium litorale]|uniref:hypothetical protein n=1 Tax=Mycolicibacterium litorale TaxID=758802 RepID=UPI0039A0CEA8